MKFPLYLISYFIFPFSFLIVRNKKKWAFGSFRGAFNDNAKALFIHTANNRPSINAAWISSNKKTIRYIQSKGLQAYYIFSIKGIWFSLTSKYWFFNSYTSDIMFCLSGGAKKINLWHGVGLKRTEFNITSGELAKLYVDRQFKECFYHPQVFQRPDYFLSSAPFQTRMFAKAFRIKESQCLEYGYPRNQILTYSDKDRISHIQKYEEEVILEIISKIKNFNKTYIYMPTWRDSQRSIFTQSMDLQKLNDILKAKNELLLLKPHANVIINEQAQKDLSNIIFIDSKLDSYPILPYTNVLITDYSSILYDYILMENKNVVLYLYDYEDYVKDRDFYYPFNENVIGNTAKTFKELCAMLKDGLPVLDEEQRSIILHRFWGNSINCNSSSKIIDKISSL